VHCFKIKIGNAVVYFKWELHGDNTKAADVAIVF